MTFQGGAKILRGGAKRSQGMCAPSHKVSVAYHVAYCVLFFSFVFFI